MRFKELIYYSCWIMSDVQRSGKSRRGKFCVIRLNLNQFLIEKAQLTLSTNTVIELKYIILMSCKYPILLHFLSKQVVVFITRRSPCFQCLELQNSYFCSRTFIFAFLKSVFDISLYFICRCEKGQCLGPWTEMLFLVEDY